MTTIILQHRVVHKNSANVGTFLRFIVQKFNFFDEFLQGGHKLGQLGILWNFSEPGKCEKL